MNVHVLQHVPFEGIGSIEEWLAQRCATVGTTRFFVDPALPPLEGIDLLIVMGGPMSVNDESAFPWLITEKAFLRAAAARGVAILGICLGAQLIASALGARVYRNPQKEIGWFPIMAVTAPAPTFRFPPTCTVFHWHGETFDLPPGAFRLARSTVCENQAFQLGERVIGLQFHLEMTPSGIAAILENCRGELVPGAYIQGAAELSATPAHYAAANKLMVQVLDYLTRAGQRR